MSFLECLYNGVNKTIEEQDFRHFVLACVEGYAKQGITVDRMQIPMNKNCWIATSKLCCDSHDL